MNSFQYCRAGMTRGEFLKRALCSGAFAAAHPLRAVAETLASGNPNLVLGIVSDVHVSMRRKNGQLVFEGEEMLRRTFEWFRSCGVDAVVICGDLADQGLREELNVVGRCWLSVFPDDRAPDGRRVEKLFVYGNHDWEGYKYGGAARKYFGAEGYDHAINKDLAAAWREAFREEYAPIWRKEIKGYSFVGAHWIADHCRGRDEIGVPQAAPWFKSNMRTLDPKKPFFYLQHPPLRNTCHGPWHWGHDIGEMTRLFAASFPNAIALTGHSHASLSDDRAIWKKEFVSINAGSLKYTGLEYGDLAPNIRENDGRMYGLSAEMMARRVMRHMSTGDGHHGLLARVYDDRIIFERRDFEDMGLLGEDWILPLGGAGAVRRCTTAPQFADDAALVVRMGGGKNRGGGTVKSEVHAALEIKIPPANRPCAGRVFDYRITIAGTNGATDEKFVFAEGFHRSATSKRANAPTVFKVALGALSARGDLDIRVAPRSSLGAEGRPLTARFTFPDHVVTASHCSTGSTIAALSDGIQPKSSGDQSVPRFTFWDHLGTDEWIQYDFGVPEEVRGVEVYWFDDTGSGRCRIPESWKVEWRPAENAPWQDVGVAGPCEKDRFCAVDFPSTVKAQAIRLAVKLRMDYSGGVLECRLK